MRKFTLKEKTTLPLPSLLSKAKWFCPFLFSFLQMHKNPPTHACTASIEMFQTRMECALMKTINPISDKLYHHHWPKNGWEIGLFKAVLTPSILQKMLHVKHKFCAIKVWIDAKIKCLFLEIACNSDNSKTSQHKQKEPIYRFQLQLKIFHSGWVPNCATQNCWPTVKTSAFVELHGSHLHEEILPWANGYFDANKSMQNVLLWNFNAQTLSHFSKWRMHQSQC